MKNEIKKEKDSVNFTLTFSKEEVEKATEDAYKREGKKYKVPGFRAGKVPRKTIEKNFGENIFFEDAVSELFSKGYRELLAQNETIEPIDHPKIDFKISPDGDLEITGSVDVAPEFKLGKYEGFEVKKTDATVTDKDIDEYLARVLEERFSLVETKKDHKIVKDNVAVIDFVGSIDGVEFEGGKAQDYELVIGSKSFIDTFEEQLIGLKAGDKKDVNVVFPKEYHAQNLAGAKAKFAVTIKKVMQRELPELDDKFAKETSEFDTLAEWKEKIRESLTRQSEVRAFEADERNLIQKIVEQNKIEVPQKMIERQLQGMLQDLDYRLQMQGMNLELYTQYLNKSIDQIKQEMTPNAILIIQTRLIFDAIAKKEKITVTPEDIESKLKLIEAAGGQKASTYKKNKEQMNYLEQDIMYTKIVDLLLEKNKLV